MSRFFCFDKYSHVLERSTVPLYSRLTPEARSIRIVHEAGPRGYGLYGQLVQKGFDCIVCAVTDSEQARQALRRRDLRQIRVNGHAFIEHWHCKTALSIRSLSMAFSVPYVTGLDLRG
ncbi:hypothetical protein PTKU46_92670 [Paraburkholderia terrae]